MSKKVLTIDLATGKKKLETVIDNSTNAAGREDMAYTAKAVDEKVSAINSAMDAAIINLRSNTTYQNAVLGIFKNKTDFTPVNNGRYIVGTQFLIYHAEVVQVGVIGEPGYVAGQPESWELISTAQNGTTVVNLTDLREYRYMPSHYSSSHKGINETSWFDVILEDGRVVYLTGDQTIDGKKTFSDDLELSKGLHVGQSLTVEGDLIVKGSTTTVDTVNLVIKDNLILLNSGEVNDGITNGAAGLDVDRGKAGDGSTNPKAQIYFNEGTQTWQAGLEGDILTIARVDDSSVTSTTSTYSVDKINNLIANTQAAATNSTLFTYTAGEDIAIGDIVYVMIDGTVAPASNDNIACMDAIAGIAIKSVLAGEVVQVAKFGRISKMSALQTGKTYFLDKDGKVATTLPSNSGEFICLIGVATDDTTMLLQIGEGILIA